MIRLGSKYLPYYSGVSTIKTMARLQFKHLCIVSVLLVLLGAALTPFIRDIVYRSEITEYFRADDQRVQDFRKLENSMGLQQTLLVLLQQDDKSFLDNNSLQTLYSAQQAIRTLPGIERITSILNNPVSNPNQETVSVQSLLRKGKPLSDADMGELADSAGHTGFTLSPDHSITAMQIYFNNEKAIEKNYATIRQQLDGLVKDHRLSRFYLLGPVEIKHALQQALLHDGLYLMPLVLVAGLGVLWFFLRSWWLVFSGAISIIVALWITAGFVGLLKLTINQTSGLAFGITFIIALADIIHLLMSYSHQPRGQGNANVMMQSLRSNLVSLFLTSLTTGIGFISLNWSSSPVFATFGNIAAIGVACAFITAIAITAVTAVLVAPTNYKGEPDIFQRLVGYTFAFTISMSRRRAALFYGVSFALCGCMVFNIFHNDPLDYFQKSSAIHQATEISEHYFGVHYPVTIQVDSGKKDGIFSHHFAETMIAFQDWLAADSRVRRQSSYLSTLRMLNRHLHEYDAKWATPPSDSQTIADLWNLYQMSSPDTSPQSLGLDAEFRRACISVGVPRMHSADLIQLNNDIKTWFHKNAPHLHVIVSGHSLLFAGIGRELTHNMFLGGLFSAMVISLVLGIFLGNMKVGIISLIPNLFPAGVIFGIWGLTKGIIDIAAAGTLSISLGIVVDDTIHILKRYMNYRTQGVSPQESLKQTFEKVGSALVLTTVVLTLGMLILTLSIFGPNRTTAQLMASIIFVALLYDLVMLPHLLMTLDRWLFSHIPTQEESTAAAST